MIYWKELAPGFAGPPVPVEINLFTLIVTALIAIAIFTVVKRKRKVQD